MTISKSKTTILAISLLITIVATLIAIPTALAQIPPGMHWDLPQAPSATRLYLWQQWQDEIPTWTYAVLSPNPVGVGQQMSIVMFNPQVPNAAYDTNDIRYQYTIVVTKPDGTTENLPATGGTFKSDSTGAAYTLYTPNTVGNYSFTVKFNSLYYRWNSTSAERNYYGVTFKESTYTAKLVVQQEAVIPLAWTPVPLPTEYWTRPIEGMNTQWYQVASNWYGSEKDENNGGESNRYQRDGTAPNSGHILWTKVTEDGGLIGGANFSTVGEVFNAGHQYQTRFTKQVILWGRLYYELPVTFGGSGGGWMAVDLRTGEELWYGKMGVEGSGMNSIDFGYYYDWDDMNQHGIVNPGWLFTEDFGASIHPRYGTYGILNLTNVPSGFDVVGPKGEGLRYVISNAGNTTNPRYYILQWNSTKVFTSQRTASQGAYPANAPFVPAPSGSNTYWNGSMWVSNSVRQAQKLASVTIPAYDWNVSASWAMDGATIRAVQYGDILIGSNGSHPARPSYDYPKEVTYWAVSLKKGSEGQLIWMKNIQTVTADNTDLLFRRAAEGVIVFQRTPICSWVGYSMYTGEKIFETPPESDFNPFGYYASSSGYNIYGNKIAYGKLFTGGYTGAVSAYDLTNGKLLWRYEAPTNMEIFKYYTLMLGAIADGKIYVGTHEHSADTPLFKGNRVRALNVTTGEEIWTMYGWANPQSFAIADGTLIYWNNYDHQVYAIGKGPSATTAAVRTNVVTQGSSILIEGTVMDISAGTKQKEQAARFPNGVAAVSDASQSHWMEYVYMQKPRPMNATGVEVTISVMDENNNFREIGKTTSSSDGFYSLKWTPDIPGKFNVYASFAGSESYWPSHAETAFVVDPAPEPAPVVEIPTPPPTETYVLYGTIAIIVAVAIVGALLAMMLRKRP